MESITNAQLCENKDKHTECPTWYTQRHVRANDMSKTHFQVLCESCNTFSIWVEKSVKNYKTSNYMPHINRVCQVCWFEYIREKWMHTNHCSEACYNTHKKLQRNKSYGRWTGYRWRTKKQPTRSDPIHT